MGVPSASDKREGSHYSPAVHVGSYSGSCLSSVKAHCCDIVPLCCPEPVRTRPAVHTAIDIIWGSTTCRGLMQERLKALKKGYGSKEVGNVTAEKVIGGMRGITVRTLLSMHFDTLPRVHQLHTVLQSTSAVLAEGDVLVGHAVGDLAAGPRGGHQVPRLQHPGAAGTPTQAFV